MDPESAVLAATAMAALEAGVSPAAAAQAAVARAAVATRVVVEVVDVRRLAAGMARPTKEVLMAVGAMADEPWSKVVKQVVVTSF